MTNDSERGLWTLGPPQLVAAPRFPRHAHPMDTTAHASAPRETTRHQLAWLRAEVSGWQADGIINAGQAEAIRSRYTGPTGSTSSVLGRVMLLLGGGFVGVGLIWLVAANLDQLSPIARFVTVAVLWLAFLIGSEVLAARRASPALVGGIRLLAALGFGAVVMQAAQSLQVPAYEPALVGVWSLGAMLHGHLTRSTMPFLVGLATGLQWWIWQPLHDDVSAAGLVISLGAGAVLAASLAALAHQRDRQFAWWWRLTAAGLALSALFAAAIPGSHEDGVVWPLWLVLELLVALVLGLAALLLVGRRPDRLWLGPATTATTLAVAAFLALWDTGSDLTDVGANEWSHAALGVAAYVTLAIALVAIDTLRSHGGLTWLAMAALVVFTTFQSFAVFAPIVTGALLFLVLGVVFVGTGLLFDRTRRHVVQALETDDHTESGAGR